MKYQKKRERVNESVAIMIKMKEKDPLKEFRYMSHIPNKVHCKQKITNMIGIYAPEACKPEKRIKKIFMTSNKL